MRFTGSVPGLYPGRVTIPVRNPDVIGVNAREIARLGAHARGRHNRPTLHVNDPTPERRDVPPVTSRVWMIRPVKKKHDVILIAHTEIKITKNNQK